MPILQRTSLLCITTSTVFLLALIKLTPVVLVLYEAAFHMCTYCC